MTAGVRYYLKYHVKIFGEGTARASIVNMGDHADVVHEGATAGPVGVNRESMWTAVELSFVATGDEAFLVLHLNASGDAIYDHGYLVSEEDYNSCVQEHSFAPG